MAAFRSLAAARRKLAGATFQRAATHSAPLLRSSNERRRAESRRRQERQGGRACVSWRWWWGDAELSDRRRHQRYDRWQRVASASRNSDDLSMQRLIAQVRIDDDHPSLISQRQRRQLGGGP